MFCILEVVGGYVFHWQCAAGIMDIRSNTAKVQSLHVSKDRKLGNIQISRRRKKCVSFPHKECSAQSYTNGQDHLSMWKFNIVLTLDLLKMFLHGVGIEKKKAHLHTH